MLRDGPLAGLRLGVLHGRLPPAEKDEVMTAFAAGRPRRAGRHHRHRGRRRRAQRHHDGDHGRRAVRHVPAAPAARPGRPGQRARDLPAGQRGAGRHRSGRVRLDAVAATNDGFELAEADLELRREGNVLGHHPGRPVHRAASSCRCCATGRSSSRPGRTRIGLVGDDPEMDRGPGLAEMVSAGDRRGEPGVPGQGLKPMAGPRARSTGSGRCASRCRRSSRRSATQPTWFVRKTFVMFANRHHDAGSVLVAAVARVTAKRWWPGI